jgi:uncharacterized protein YajQ (UPF0234 family)
MPSFDIVSQVNIQEVKNAVDQANREARTRFDFKGTFSEISWKDKSSLELDAPSEDRLKALVELLKEKLVSRKVSLKGIKFHEIKDSAKGRVKQLATIQSGLDQTQIKKIQELIKTLKLKNISYTPQGDQLRVSGKKRDDLQLIIKTLKNADLDYPLEFTNFKD